ncbi:MAG: glycosyltransferase family 4 protein [Acidobacteria bacterium]|nr:glycosyltransferase family 4 protein [Acidobacteriota bacterium]
MNIGYDIRPFLKNETGVGVYFRNLLQSLSRLDRDNSYFLFSSSFKDRFSADKIPSFSRMSFRDKRIPVRVMNCLWYRLEWPPLDLFFRTRLDLTHSPTPLLLPSRGRKIVTVYDLFFVEYPEKADREAGRVFNRKIHRSLREADGIITISRFTRDRILDLFPVDEKKIRVIPLGLHRNFWVEGSIREFEETKSRLGLPSSYILFVGAMERRKNLVRLIEAFDLIQKRKPDLSLVIAGREGEDTPAVRARIRDLRLESRVHLIGYCRETDLRSLYRLADAFVFPSLYEGFGLPLLEAMACELPVAASGTSALTEVGGDAALYFNPDDPGEMAAVIERVLEDSALRSRLQVKGKKRVEDFSWKDAAADTLAFYRTFE